ncbi:hypothetical protein [Streptosporangium longisporum]|uniref:hypothetical protein n=1 Tax=Streptosporangium longisporum TaxID=46187 RepID=UPI0031F11086
MSDDYSISGDARAASGVLSPSRAIPVIQNHDDRRYLYAHSSAAGPTTDSEINSIS